MTISLVPTVHWIISKALLIMHSAELCWCLWLLYPCNVTIPCPRHSVNLMVFVGAEQKL